jgi:hypothetical protein
VARPHLAAHRPVAGAGVAGALLLGGWAWIAAAYGRRVPAAALGTGALVLVTVACLLARPVPDRLADYPTGTEPLPRHVGNPR